VYPAEDLGLLCLGGVLQQVGDLGWLEPADAGERAAKQRAARVADEPLEVVPVPEGAGAVLALRAEQPEQPARAAPGIHPRQHPLVARLPRSLPVQGQLQVGGANEARVRHVDEPVTQHVGPEQHLTLAPVEVAQVEPRARQPQRIAVEAGHLVDWHEDLAPAHGGHQPGDERVVGTAEPDDDVGEPPDRFAGAVRHRPVEQPRQPQRGLVARRAAEPGGGCGRHGSLFLLGQAMPSLGSITVSPGATLALAGERAIYGVVLPA
jgi:hypothetical protein